LKSEGALIEIISPKVGGIQANDGSWISKLRRKSTAAHRFFTTRLRSCRPRMERKHSLKRRRRATSSPTLSRMKYIGYVDPATIFIDKAGISESRDEGFITLKAKDDCSAFVAACRQLRYWARAKG
jgi:catalase